MEERLDAWLKTYRTETLISPVDWESVPEDCRVRLDQHARDQAVQRADKFADDGDLDLRRQEAVRQFVDAMAQCWRLPGDDIRRMVEDYYDELKPRPGQEFEKLAIRLFRRTFSAPASELFNQFDPAEEHPVIAQSAKYLDVPPNQRLDKKGFLHALHLAYDTWTTKQPKEAVHELLDTCGLDQEPVPFSQILPFLENRGARIWRKALMLEEDIGVDEGTREELIRILKRYALLVRRGGPEAIGLAEAPAIPTAKPEVGEEDADSAVPPPPAEPVPATGVTEDPETGAVEEEAPADTEPEQLESLPQQQEPEREADEAAEEEEAPEAPSPADTEPQTPNRKSKEVTFQFRPPEVSDVRLPEMDNESDDEDDEDDEVEEDEEREDVDVTNEAADVLPETEPVVDEVIADTDADLESPEDFHFDSEMLNRLTARDRSALKRLFGGKDRVQAAKTGELVEEPEPVGDAGKAIEAFDREPEPETGFDVDDDPSDWDEGIRPRSDRFAPLREGDLRDKVVDAIYGGDDTQFDIFLAQLSAAEDWEAGKQFIAREMHKQNVNLEMDPAKQLFFALKRCMTGSGGE